MLLKTVPIVGCSHYNQYLNAQSLKGLLKVGYNNHSVIARGCLGAFLASYIQFGNPILNLDNRFYLLQYWQMSLFALWC